MTELTTPENLNTVNSILTYLLGLMVLVIGYLYKEKSKETKLLNDRIKEVYEEHKEDLKFFSEEKTKSVVDVTNAMNKVVLMIEQLGKLIEHNKNG